MNIAADFSKQVRPVIEAELARLANEFPRGLIADCARYALLPPGKLLRPVLFSAVLADHQADWREFVSVGATIEALHVASLIHDDLPCLDNDDERRGRLSSHKKFGESIALLTGDSLPCLAIGRLNALGISPELRLAIISELLGTYSMICHGQALDLDRRNHDQLEVAVAKTAALFRATFSCAGMCAGLPNNGVKALGDFGEQFGVLFQLEDDIGDASHDAIRVGMGTTKDISTHGDVVMGGERLGKRMLSYQTPAGRGLSLTIDIVSKWVNKKDKIPKDVASIG